MTPFDELADPSVVERVIRDLYDVMFDDAMVGFFFVGKDKDRIVTEQVKLVRRVLGDDSVVYDGESMPDAHARVPILPGHFDRRHQLLREALERHPVPDRVRARWLAVDVALRDVILKAGRVRIDELRRLSC